MQHARVEHELPPRSISRSKPSPAATDDRPGAHTRPAARAQIWDFDVAASAQTEHVHAFEAALGGLHRTLSDAGCAPPAPVQRQEAGATQPSTDTGASADAPEAEGAIAGDAAFAPYVQRRASGPAGGGDVRAAASRGLRGGGGGLPHADRIRQAFGRHDVSSVRSVVGGQAADACRAMGAEAYASGEAVAFRGAPSLFTAAHELAHVVQQRRGVSLRGGVGESGDRYEREADSIAHAVVRGESAEPLLDRMTQGAAGSGVARGDVQRIDAKPERSKEQTIAVGPVTFSKKQIVKNKETATEYELKAGLAKTLRFPTSLPAVNLIVGLEVTGGAKVICAPSKKTDLVLPVSLKVSPGIECGIPDVLGVVVGGELAFETVFRWQRGAGWAPKVDSAVLKGKPLVKAYFNVSGKKLAVANKHRKLGKEAQEWLAGQGMDATGGAVWEWTPTGDIDLVTYSKGKWDFPIKTYMWDFLNALDRRSAGRAAVSKNADLGATFLARWKKRHPSLPFPKNTWGHSRWMASDLQYRDEFAAFKAEQGG